MKRSFITIAALIVTCALLLPLLASCEIGGKQIWFVRENDDIEYYISFDEKSEEILVVVVDGRDAESYTFDYEIDDDEIEIKDAAKNKVVFSYKEKSESYVMIDGVKFKLTDEGPDDYDEGEREFTVYELLGTLGESVLSGTYTAEDEDDGQTSTITFNADGSLTVTNVSTNGTEKTMLGTYELKEDTIVITVDGTEAQYPYSFEDGKINIDGVEYLPSKDQSSGNDSAETLSPSDNNEGDMFGPRPSYTENIDTNMAAEPEPLPPDPTDTDNMSAGDIGTNGDRIGDIIGNYESFDEDGDGVEYLFVFDVDRYSMYAIKRNDTLLKEEGAYSIKDKKVYIGSGSFEIDFERGFVYDGMTFYKTTPYPEYPDMSDNSANAGINTAGTAATKEDPTAPQDTVADIGSAEDVFETDVPVNDTAAAQETEIQ